MTISERVLAGIKQQGMTQKEFSRKTGISESTISGWKKKGLNPAADKILIICEVLELGPYELLAGSGNDKYEHPDLQMIRKGSEEYTFLEHYFGLDSDARKRLLGYMDALKDMTK